MNNECILLGLTMYYLILVLAIVVNVTLCRNDQLCTLRERFRNASEYKTIVGRSNYIDVFTVVINPEDYEYIRRGEFWLNYKLMTTLARHHDLRIHIISNVDWIIDQGHQQGYFMHDLRDFKDLNNTFFALYQPNHHSINFVHYEYLCFYRWIVYNHIVETWPDKHRPINNIMTLDSDVVFFVDPVEYYFKTLETLGYIHEKNKTLHDKSTSFDLVIVSPGAVHLFSNDGLKSYSDYIVRWYNRSSDAIVQETKQNAGYLYRQLHFSDMQMVNAFAKIDTQRRTDCYVSASTDPVALRSNEGKMLLVALACVPITNYRAMIKSGNHLVFKQGTFHSVQDTLPICYAGDGVKEMMKVFTRALLMNETLGNNTIVQQQMHSFLLIRAHNAHAVYNVTKDHSKVWLTWEQFSGSQYTDGMVVNVPADLVRLFPDKPQTSS